MEHNLELNSILKELPRQPGIYKMFDSLGNIIYIGKAKNLKNRVSQYFRKDSNRAPKVLEMINNIHTLAFQVSDTELDAFIEECRLIKEIKPKYNKQLKNTSNYLYIKFPDEPFPKITIATEHSKEGARYFGPFTSRHRVEAAVRYLNNVYPLRKCTVSRLVSRKNGCLFLQLGSCLGVCTGRVEPAEYRTYLEKAQLLLTGKSPGVLQRLQDQVALAAGELKFEQAAQFREYYLGLRHVIRKQHLVDTSSKGRNVLAVEFIRTESAKLFFIKGNKLLSSQVVNISGQSSQELCQILLELVPQIFATKSGDTYNFNQQDLDEAQIIYSYLKRNKQQISTFWVPANRLKGGTLDSTIKVIADRLMSGK